MIYSSVWLTPDGAAELYVEWACNDIYRLFTGEYSIAEYYYDHVENFHAQANWSIISGKIEHCEQSHTFATVLYIGHGGLVNMGNYYRYSIFEHRGDDNCNPPPAINNTQIYGKTVNGKHRFIFLWACWQGNEPGSGTPAIHGMAYCWTRQPNLNENGYDYPDSRPYCFIGFKNVSQWLNASISANNNYKHWLVFFYYYALNGYRIKDSLDRACQIVGYSNWKDSPLYKGFEVYWPFNCPSIQPGRFRGVMRVFGNSTIYLVG
ncbi:MAG: hypothetical protein QW175_03765 [Candidatus Bathyarchaeia archaeon]